MSVDLDLAEWPREHDWYSELSKMLPNPTDYFDFPSSMLAFSESLSSSRLMTVNDNQAFFRLRGNQLTLMTYYVPGEQLRLILESLSQDFKVKCLNFVNKDMTGLKKSSYGNEHWIDQGWTVDNVLKTLHHHEAYKYRRAIRGCEDAYDIEMAPPIDDVIALFNAWVEEAKHRHFMVVQGHYWRYILRYYDNPNNVKLYGFRRKADGKLWGIVGYEVFRNQAQMTLGKHRTGDYYFSRWMWLKVLQLMLSEGVTKCYCGTTADELKQQLQMSYGKSFKVGLG